MFRKDICCRLLLSVTLTFLSLTDCLCAKSRLRRRSRLQGRAASSTFTQSVTKNRYGKGGQEYWIFEPDSPKPRTAPVIVFLHGWGGMNPLYYGAWLDHLVKRGNIVVYPRYQATLLTPIKDFTPNTLRQLKMHLSRLKTEPGHVTS